MRSYEEVQRAAKERAAREFSADVARRNEGIKNVSRATKEPVQDIKEVKEVSYSKAERKENEQAMFEFSVWVHNQVDEGTKEAISKNSI